MNTTRKEFLRSAGAVLGGLALGGGTGTAVAATAVATGGTKTYPQAPVVGSRRVDADFTGPKSKVFFSKTIDAEHSAARPREGLPSNRPRKHDR